MSIVLMGRVWEDHERFPIGGTELLVMLALADWSNDAGVCWPSQRKIAQRARCTERQVRRVLNTLIERGLVTLARDGEGDRKRVYKLFPEAADKMSPTHSDEDMGVLSTGHGRPIAPDMGVRSTRARQESLNRQGTINGTVIPPSPPEGDVPAVFEAWKEAVGKNGGTVLDDKRQRAIVKALRIYPLRDVLDAARGIALDPYNMGDNDTGKAYNDVTLALRDAAHIERFRDLKRGLIPIPTRRKSKADERSERAAIANAIMLGDFGDDDGRAPCDDDDIVDAEVTGEDDG